jgi:hypothetical protein
MHIFFLSLFFFLSTHKKYFLIFRVHERVQYVLNIYHFFQFFKRYKGYLKKFLPFNEVNNNSNYAFYQNRMLIRNPD